MLHCAFERAVKERLILRNSTDNPPDCIKAYLNAAKARSLLPLFHLEPASGLRKGKLVALLRQRTDC